MWNVNILRLTDITEREVDIAFLRSRYRLRLLLRVGGVNDDAVLERLVIRFEI